MSSLDLSAAISKFMSSFAGVEQISALQQKIDKLEQRILELESANIKFEKEVYSIKDLQKLMNLGPDAIRNNYIKTGVIKARIPDGCKAWEISKDEFFRVAEIVKTFGRHHLLAA